MSIEARITGVMALVVIPEDLDAGFLSITEQRFKRASNRIKGARSMPMETSDPGENDNQTLARLFQEEIKIVSSSINIGQEPLSLIEIAPSTVGNAYLVEVASDVKAITGSDTGDVDNIVWTKFDEVLSTPAGSLVFRPGVFEIVDSYFQYLRKSDHSQPPFIPYSQIMHPVPTELFDLLDQGINESIVLSRFGFPGQLELGFQQLSR